MEGRRPARPAMGAAVLAAAFWSPFLGPASAETTTDAVVSPAATPSPAEARVRLLDLVNRDRAAAGLPWLRLRDDLDALAGEHSLRMAAADDIFHNDDLFTTATKSLIGAATVAENVAVNASVDDAHRRLMDSPGHRANILSPDFSLLGIGAVNANGSWFLTEVFIRPVSTAVLSSSAAPATQAQPVLAADAGARAPDPAAKSGLEGPPAPATAAPATAPPATAPATTAPLETASPATAQPDAVPTGDAGAGATTSGQAGAPAPRPSSSGIPGGLSGGAAALMLAAGAGAAAVGRRQARSGQRFNA